MCSIAISIRNLNFSYSGSPAKNMNRAELSVEKPDNEGLNKNIINNFNLEVPTGSFTSIIGPNGSGKSTLINLISKVLRGYSGSITIFGKDIHKLGSRDIAKFTAVVPQYSNPAFNFTVEEMILMGRYPYISRFGSEKAADFEIVKKVMQQSRVAHYSNKKFNELSGGEKQRVIIAQALVQDTPIILLDEPTSHLDINFQIEIMELFSSLNRNENKTVIGVFHDINLAASYAGNVVFLKEGRVFTQGIVEETITRENIKSVFGSDVYVGKNPFTGKIYISPTFMNFTPGGIAGKELTEKSGKKIHIIGGGGAASPVLTYLSRLGFSLTCGVINNFDSDLDTAQILGISYVNEAPFSPISLYSQNKNLEYIRQSDAVILPPVIFGHGNFSNLISVKEAQEMGKKVIVIDGKEIEKRDYTGGKVKNVYEKILQKGAIVIDDIHKVMDFL